MAPPSSSNRPDESISFLGMLYLQQYPYQLDSGEASVTARYVPGQEGAARAMLALRQGWKGLSKIPLIPDRAALIFSAGLLLPYSTPEVAASISKVHSQSSTSDACYKVSLPPMTPPSQPSSETAFCSFEHPLRLYLETSDIIFFGLFLYMPKHTVFMIPLQRYVEPVTVLSLAYLLWIGL